MPYLGQNSGPWWPNHKDQYRKTSWRQVLIERRTDSTPKLWLRQMHEQLMSDEMLKDERSFFSWKKVSENKKWTIFQFVVTQDIFQSSLSFKLNKNNWCGKIFSVCKFRCSSPYQLKGQLKPKRPILPLPPGSAMDLTHMVQDILVHWNQKSWWMLLQ